MNKLELETQELEIYSNFVSQLAQNKSEVLISNGMLDHARILIANLIFYAGKKVQIFTTNLRPEIYEHYSTVNALKAFLSKENTVIQILLQDRAILDSPEILKDHELIKECMSELPSGTKCEIRVVSDAEDAQIKEHFVIMDSEGYRFCPDKKEPVAIATFRSPIAALNLTRQFDILFDRSTPITIPV
ncbi:MAG: hypothetical protein ABI865_08150 [Nitrosospira sp.]